MSKLVYQSSKTYTHAQGLSCCFRQHKADSHCRFLHGYALSVRVVFEGVVNDPSESGLDHRNWVVDVGALKKLKQFLEEQFDHKTIIASSDPYIEDFKFLASREIIDLKIEPVVGCEAFCDRIYAFIDEYIIPEYRGRVVLREVEVREHDGNGAKMVLVDD